MLIQFLDSNNLFWWREIQQCNEECNVYAFLQLCSGNQECLYCGRTSQNLRTPQSVVSGIKMLCHF